jgi:hypothetical protein
MLIRSYAPIPNGIDVGIRGDLLLYFHKLGSQIPFDSQSGSAMGPGNLAELPQNPTITRPVFNLAVTIGF